MSQTTVILSLYPAGNCHCPRPPLECVAGEQIILIVDPALTADGTGTIIADILSVTLNKGKYEYLLCFDPALLNGVTFIEQKDIEDFCCFTCQSQFTVARATTLAAFVDTAEETNLEFFNLDIGVAGNYGPFNLTSLTYNNPAPGAVATIAVWYRWRVTAILGPNNGAVFQPFRQVDGGGFVQLDHVAMDRNHPFTTWKDDNYVEFFTVPAGGSITIDTRITLIISGAAPPGTSFLDTMQTDIRIFGVST